MFCYFPDFVLFSVIYHHPLQTATYQYRCAELALLGTVDETDAGVVDSPSSPSQITYFHRCQELAILGVTQEETDSDSERHPVVDYTGLNNHTYTAWVDA